VPKAYEQFILEEQQEQINLIDFGQHFNAQSELNK
jgi:hypothetical protein